MTSLRPPIVTLHSLFFDVGQFDILGRLMTGWRFVHLCYADEPWTGPAIEGVTTENDVELAIERIGALGEGPVHLIGASMGAYVGMRVAAARPDLVRSLILMGCTARGEERRELRETFVGHLEGPPGESKADQIEQLMFGPAFRRTRSAELERWRMHFAALGAGAAVAAKRVFGREPLWAFLDRVRCPLLLLAGRDDVAKPPWHMQEMAERHPGATLVVLDRSGHSPAVEVPERVAAHLHAWLAGDEAGTLGLAVDGNASHPEQTL